MIDENQENVMDAYTQMLGGNTVELNESEESVFESDINSSSQSVLEAYNASNKAVADKEAELITEKYKKMKEEDVCDKCKKESCVCDEDVVEEGDDKDADDKEDDVIEEEEGVETNSSCDCEGDDCDCEEEVVVKESEFQTFMKTRLSEMENSEDMNSEDMLDFFAESEILWEESKDDRAAYQAFVKKELGDRDLGKMSDEETKKFYDEIDKKWNSEDEAGEDGPKK